MRYTVRLLSCLALALLAGGSHAVHAGESGAKHRGKHVSLSLLSDVQALVPEASFRVGVHLRLGMGWHAYWKEPGDAGMAPSFEWSLPPGFEVESESWPVPAWHKAEDTWTMVYEPDVLIVFHVRAPKTIAAVTDLSVRVDWVVCHDVDGCVPGDARLTLRLPKAAGTAAEPSAQVAAFDRQQKTVPGPMPTSWALSSDRRLLRLSGEGAWSDAEAVFEFYPQDFESFDRSARLLHERSEDGVTIRLPFVRASAGHPDTFRGVLTIRAGGKTSAYAVGWRR